MTGTPVPSADHDHRPPLDLVGIGIGAANLALAALADGMSGGPRTAFYEQRHAWGDDTTTPLTDGATRRVPFLADLVSLADPGSPWSFLRYLRARDRLFPFCAAGSFHIQRAEYHAYCRWVAGSLPGLRFGHQVDSVRWNPERALFEVDFTQLDADGEAAALGRAHTRAVVVGTGAEPYVPEPLRPLADAPSVPVVHSADYLRHRDSVLAAEHVTVVGSGQSGAEVVLDLLRARPAGRGRLHWIGRTDSFTSAEPARLGLEHLGPDHARYLHALPPEAREALAPHQRRLHHGIDPVTADAIHGELYRRALRDPGPGAETRADTGADAVLVPGVRVRTAGRVATTRVELHLEHLRQGTRSRLTTDAVVLATGYRERPVGRVLAGLDPYLRRDAGERPRTDESFRLALDPSVTGAVYVYGGDTRTHGTGAPGPWLTAWRAATVLNAVTGREVYPLPRRTAFTTFGLAAPAPAVPGPGRPLTPLARN
ncbi:SidA/IucD/PvdA family monooxygenase [Streptomyces sp. NPDC020875]|uniref:lysine N(6)-hydroxylase/L-ornithine N(5)-oxygenase family protein n=1 Tax=Streptomyces sp. NPDC020875 TaxID=3154898 RepID=UPI0033EC8195